ncbi:MAG: S8 family serine peptidase [Bdellovibrionota bacterium]|nr:S8 family serine peptidase [Bdellovibrionota bacterium]
MIRIFLLAALFSTSLYATEKTKNYSILFEFKNKPSKLQLKNVQSVLKNIKVELFDNFNNDYFKRLYRINFKGNEAQKKAYETLLLGLPFVKKIEPIHQVEALSIKVNPNSPRLENDTFFSYQWGLYNSGQRVLKDLDDIHSEVLEGKKGMDIGWKSIRNELSGLMKKEAIVAVLDSGLDLEHVDLKENILKNEKECNSRGGLPFRAKEDKDENGLKGDCMGWNFTSNKKGGDNRPYDDIGHGTHVAGIIAATPGNKKGITGVSSKIKILPIKVLQKNEGGRSSRGPNGSLTDRIAKGILYAVKMKADVINMSLGWPLILDTTYLKEAVKAALEENVIIVAAAGNNNNRAPIFPCSYEGVLCVGSMSIDGKISNFSNYGGHVDVLAPGDNILSTYPQKLDPDFFSVKGYEVKNGTSQSAPYISALAGILKSINPEMTSDEVKARILSSTRKFNSRDKYVSNGLAHMERSINAKKAPLIRPLFKDLKTLQVDPEIKRWSINIKVKNYWKEANNITLKVKSLNAPFMLEKNTFKFKTLKQGEEKIFSLQGNISDLREDNSFDLQTDIYIEGKRHGSFKNRWKVSRTLKGNDFTEVPIEGDSKEMPLARVFKENFIPLLRTVQDPYFQLKYPEYYLTKLQKENNPGLKIFIFKIREDKFKKQERDIFLPYANQLLSITSLDMNYDGKRDYFIRYLVKNENKKFIGYSYFNSEGEPLFGKYSHHSFTPETVILDLKKAVFVPSKVEKLGLIAVPLFLTNGRIPEQDQDTDPWVSRDLSKRDHFYFLKPQFDKESGQFQVKTRIVDNYIWEKALRQDLSLKWNDQMGPLYILPQSFKDFKRGIARGLISAGKNYETKAHILELRPNNDFDSHFFRTKEVHIEGHELFPVTEIREKVHFKSASTLVGLYNETTIRFSEISGEYPTFNHTNIYRQNYKRDHIFGALASYKKRSNSYTFFQTKGNLKLHTYNSVTGKSLVTSRPIQRFSFLPGALFSETFYPIVKGQESEALPALYVDATQINRSDIYILTVDKKNRLVSPIKYNLSIPKNCKSMNPVPFGEKRTFSFTLFCQKGEKQYSLNFLKLK